MENENNKMSWEAPEFIHYPKNYWWYFVLVLFGGILIAYFAFFQKDFLTATLFFLLLVFSLYFAKQKPKKVQISLTQNELKIGENSIPYSQLKSFWIVYNPPEVKILNFETTAYLNRYITLQLGNQNPIQIREFVLEHVPENHDGNEQISDRIARKLKF